MSAPGLDMGTGFDTGETVRQLMELERAPIRRIEEQNENLSVHVRAWEEVRIRTRDLQEKSRTLYSFAGPFATKEVRAINSTAITGEAAPHVEPGRERVEVKRLASYHQLHSNSFSLEEPIEAGRFRIEVGEESREIEFGGGTLTQLQRSIQTAARDLYDSSLVRISSREGRLVMRSRSIGSDGALSFGDPDGILQTIGLVGMVGEPREERVDLLWQETNIEEIAPAATIEAAGRRLQLAAGGEVVLREELKGATELTFRLKAEELPAENAADDAAVADGADGADDAAVADEKPADERRTIALGPEIGVNIGGVRLRADNIGREAPADLGRLKESEQAARSAAEAKSEAAATPPPATATPAAVSPGRIGIAYRSGEGEAEELVFLERDIATLSEKSGGVLALDLKELAGAHEIAGLYFAAGSGHNLSIEDLKVERIDEGELVFGPLHESQKAEDAHIVVNGIEVSRSSNAGLTDIIEGVSLDLHHTTEGPVELAISVNADEIVQLVKDWIESYNELMQFARDNSQPMSQEDFKMQRPGERGDMGDGLRTMQANSGIFTTDSTMRQLTSSLRMVISQAYPNRHPESYRMLSQIGISTGEPGREWQASLDGKLKLDEPRLRESLGRSPDAVRQLFASDNNFDATPDDGVAYKMSQTLHPYNRQAGGLISARIDMLKTQVSDNKDRMDRLELSMESKEESLRRRFGRMQSSMRKNQNRGEYLRNNLPRQN